MNRVVHFEIHTENIEKTIKFYTDVFGWESRSGKCHTLAKKTDYWTVTTGAEGEPGINGGIVFRRGTRPTFEHPVNSFICTISVSSVDEYLEKITGAGGGINIPKMPVKGIGWLAYCVDTEETFWYYRFR